MKNFIRSKNYLRNQYINFFGVFFISMDFIFHFKIIFKISPYIISTLLNQKIFYIFRISLK
jgi:hypothetical protein